MLKRSFLFLFLGIIIGCKGKDKLLGPKDARPDVTPSGACFQNKGLALCLLIAHEHGLTLLEYDSQNRIYRKKAQISSSELSLSEKFFPVNVAVFPNYIFLAATIGEDPWQGNGVIFRFNSDLKEKTSKEFKNPITAMSQDSQNLFVGLEAQKSNEKTRFLSLNQQLNELDGIELETSFNKAIDSIIIYQDFAYLLDNLVFPIYLFKVNIKDPKDMKITKRIEFDTTGAPSDHQWLNPRYDQWVVVYRYGHRGGGGQTVRIYPMKGGTNLRKEETIYSFDSLEEKEEGTKIRAVTSLPPIWAVVHQAGKEKYQLAQIETKSDQIKFSYSLALDKQDTRYIIKRKHDYLFLAYGHTLIIINIKGRKANVFFTQNLKSLDITKVVDILPY
jgi:hypothetical protein